jgi:metal-responsive CopG/Arc/MetJ family transcriptional regulator
MQGQTQSVEATKAIQIRFDENLFSAIESWRRKQEIIPSRPEAIRRLLSRLLADNAAAEHDEGEAA